MADGLDVLLNGPAAPAQQTGLDVLLAAPNQATATMTQAAPQPVGLMGNLTGGASALGHHLMNLPHGIAQLVENGVAKGSGALSNALGSPDNAVNRYIQQTAARDNTAMQQREKDYQAQTPDSPGAYAGATVGEIAPWLIGGPLNALAKGAGEVTAAAASKIPLLSGKLGQTVAGGAGQGAFMGAAAPVTGEDYWADKANQVKMDAAVGGGIAGGAKAAAGLYNAVKNAAAPVLAPKSVAGGTLVRAAGSDPQAVAKALTNNATELVPGSTPTTAQVAGSQQMVQLEKAFGNTPEGKALLEGRQLQNNNARISALESIAGTDADLLAAKQARAEATAEWTHPTQGKLATGAPVDAQPILQQLEALKRSPLGIRPTIGAAADDMIAAIRAHAVEDPQTGAAVVQPGILDAVRQNVKDYLAKHAPNGVVGTQQGVAFEPVRNSIVSAIEGANPGYRDYLATYARRSEPIRSMEAGRAIMDGLTGGRDSLGQPLLSLAKYNSLRAKADKGEYALAPEARAKLDAIQQDLQRASISNSLRQPGSDTLYNANADGLFNRLIYGNDFKGGFLPKATGAALGSAMGAVVGHPIYGAGIGAAGASKLSSLAGQRYTEALGDALLNPMSAQNALAKQTTPSEAKEALMRALRSVPLLSAIKQ